MASCQRSTDGTATTPSIKVEPTEGESPLTVPPPLPHNESTNQSTVKCEWTLAGVCVCADGKCEDCQANDKEDEKDNILRMTLAAASLNSPENGETEFHPPIWEDCEEAENTDNASEAASEDVKPVLAQIDDNLDNLDNEQMIAQVNPEESFPLSPRNQNASQEAEMEEAEEEASQMAVNVDSVSPVALRRSTRVRNRPVNYAVLSEAEDDPETDTSDSEEGDSDESVTETDSEMETDEPREAEIRSSIAAGSRERHSRRSFPCRKCKKGFASKHSARRHENTLHHAIQRPRNRPYVCSAPDCGKAFEYQFRLNAHTIIHSGLKPFTCATCGAAFTQASNLRSHQRTHSDARPYVCAVCKKAYKWKGDLVRHNLLHSSLKPSTCPVDGESDSDESETDSETGLRPFTCTTCGATFNRKGNLNFHQLTHTAERPYVCALCKMAFKRKQTLVRHYLIHSSGRVKQSFPCADCGRSFTLKDNLQRHRRQFHSI